MPKCGAVPMLHTIYTLPPRNPFTFNLAYINRINLTLWLNLNYK